MHTIPKDYRRVVLASRPQGLLREDHFRIETLTTPQLAEGQILVRQHYLSIDPYMRARLDEAKSYALPQALGETMLGGTVGEVIASRHPHWQVGDKLAGSLGWAELALSDGTALRRIPNGEFPLSWHLGVLGMPGATAWFGLNQVLQVKAGETVVVSAASGAVGSLVGQLAKLAGCCVVGIAGGVEKARYVCEDLGFDACVDYRANDAYEQLKAACPKGIDALFENVGGAMFDLCLKRMNPFARIALCGMIADYQGQTTPLHHLRQVISMRVKVQGFIITDHLDLWPRAWAELSDYLQQGQLHIRESISSGLAQAPGALVGLLQGRNWGKQIVRLIDTD